MLRDEQKTPNKAFATPSVLAAEFGVSLATVRRWRKQKRIPFSRLGRNTYRFDVAAVKEALETTAGKETFA